jgi:hypothetical protein
MGGCGGQGCPPGAAARLALLCTNEEHGPVAVSRGKLWITGTNKSPNPGFTYWNLALPSAF